jgi:hypothetical protein
MSTVVYRNLLFSAHFGQAGGKDKIPEIRQEIHRLLFGLLKSPCVGIERQSGFEYRASFWTTLTATVLLPYTHVGHILGFQPLPIWLLGFLVMIVTSYIAAAEIVKRMFYRRIRW